MTDDSHRMRKVLFDALGVADVSVPRCEHLFWHEDGDVMVACCGEEYIGKLESRYVGDARYHQLSNRLVVLGCRGSCRHWRDHATCREYFFSIYLAIKEYYQAADDRELSVGSEERCVEAKGEGAT